MYFYTTVNNTALFSFNFRHVEPDRQLQSFQVIITPLTPVFLCSEFKTKRYEESVLYGKTL